MKQQLRIAYVPQVPGRPFYKEVADIEEALLIGKTLVDFSLFEYKQRVKPDYTDFIDLEELNDGEWESWYNDEWEDFSELLAAAEK